MNFAVKKETLSQWKRIGEKNREVMCLILAVFCKFWSIQSTLTSLMHSAQCTYTHFCNKKEGRGLEGIAISSPRNTTNYQHMTLCMCGLSGSGGGREMSEWDCNCLCLRVDTTLQLIVSLHIPTYHPLKGNYQNDLSYITARFSVHHTLQSLTQSCFPCFKYPASL
jgi:hypothetical protein